MPFKVTNTSSLFSTNQLQKSQENLLSSLEKLSSGRRINKAADDASGLVIADALSSQARGFGQAIRNASDAISIVQIADSSLGQATDLVNDIRVKSLQAANASQSAESRQAIQADIEKSLVQLNNIAQNTTFNGQDLLSGNFTNKSFQVGANPNETIDVSIDSIETANLGSQESGQLSDINVLTEEGAQQAVAIADEALAQINRSRSTLGSQQNQLSSTISNLSTSRINTLSAESTIRDLDFAEEIINFNKFEILNKARSFASAQANATGKNVLNLLQGEL